MSGGMLHSGGAYLGVNPHSLQGGHAMAHAPQRTRCYAPRSLVRALTFVAGLHCDGRRKGVKHATEPATPRSKLGYGGWTPTLHRQHRGSQECAEAHRPVQMMGPSMCHGGLASRAIGRPRCLSQWLRPAQAGVERRAPTPRRYAMA